MGVYLPEGHSDGTGNSYLDASHKNLLGLSLVFEVRRGVVDGRLKTTTESDKRAYEFIGVLWCTEGVSGSGVDVQSHLMPGEILPLVVGVGIGAQLNSKVYLRQV